MIVDAGQKTAVAAPGAAPAPSAKMSSIESAEIQPVLGRLTETHKMIATDESQAWFKKAAGSDGSGDIKKSLKDEKGNPVYDAQGRRI